MKRRRLAWKGGGDGLDSKVYLFILDSRQLEAAVGSNDLFISCHVLGSVDAMLRFIHAVGLLKLAVLVPVHACTQQITLEETRSELFWGETGLKIRPDVFRHDNCERISYLF